MKSMVEGDKEMPRHKYVVDQWIKLKYTGIEEMSSHLAVNNTVWQIDKVLTLNEWNLHISIFNKTIP